MSFAAVFLGIVGACLLVSGMHERWKRINEQIKERVRELEEEDGHADL